MRCPKLKSMSKIAEFARQVLDLVSVETEISQELILSKSRSMDIVDARHLAIKLLHSKDVYPKRIAEFFGITPRSVHYIITTFDARLQANKSLRNNYAKIAKQIGNNYEATMK